jgi:hypothetical protein
MLFQTREQGRPALELRGQRLDGAQRGGADVVFHALDVVLDHALVYPKELEEIRQELVAPGDVAGQGFTGGGQDQAAILLVIEEALGIKPLHHVGDACLRDAETRRDIDDAGVTLGVDQFEDALQVILDRGGAPRSICFSRHADKNERAAPSVKQKNISD